MSAATERGVASPTHEGWHPSVDEFGDGFIVFATPERFIVFTEPFASFLAEAAARGERPVLMTSLEAQVSAHVSLAMRASAGVWAVQRGDGATFDAFTGRQIEQFAELWEGSIAERDRWVGFTDPVGQVQVLSLDVRVRLQADERSRVGRIAELVADQIGERWECWGTREPFIEPWDPEELTRVARGAMPDTGWLRMVGTGGAFGQVQVSRTISGLTEHTVVGFVLPDALTRGDVVDRATVALEHLAEVGDVSLGFASLLGYEQVRGCVVQAGRARLPDIPIAVLVGPRGVRDLGVDIVELGKGHDVRRLGRAKTPSLLVRFTQSNADVWEQVARLGMTIGPGRIADAMGIRLKGEKYAD